MNARESILAAGGHAESREVLLIPGPVADGLGAQCLAALALDSGLPIMALHPSRYHAGRVFDPEGRALGKLERADVESILDRARSSLAGYAAEREGGPAMDSNRGEVLTGIGRAHWASYLVNGDDSGIDPREREAANRFAAWLCGDTGTLVSCSDESFYGRPDGEPGALPGDCLEYVAIGMVTESTLAAARLRPGMFAGAKGKRTRAQWEADAVAALRRGPPPVQIT